jgi:hypothetical protein
MGAAITDTFASIEKAYQATKQAAAAISVLYAKGAATCEDVKGYNLMALGVYATQKTLLDALIAQGVDTKGMKTPPTPTLFYWGSKSGQDAALVDCSKPLSGLRGPKVFLPPDSLRIVFGTCTQDGTYTQDKTSVQPRRTDMMPNTSQGLGALPLAYWVLIAGVALLVTYEVATIIVDWLKAREISKQVAEQLEVKAQNAKDLWIARAGYVASCKGDTADCANKAIELFPEPDLSVQYPPNGGGWGLMSWAIVLGGAGVVGALLYRKYQRDGHILPQRSES